MSTSLLSCGRELTMPLPPHDPSATQCSGDLCLEGSMGSKMGISTVGYRSGKFTVPEWHENNYSKYHQAFQDRENAERIRNSSKQTEAGTLAQESTTQLEVTRRLKERVHDTNFWKYELNREVEDVIAETDRLVSEKRRLESALRATEVPMHIVTECLGVRERRQGGDKVSDEPEDAMLKELEIINNVRDLLARTIKQAEQQIKRNRDGKSDLEMDWSDKLEAAQIDARAANLHNESTDIMFYPGSAKFEDMQSTPESWAQFSHDNIVRAETERMASIQLRDLIGNILSDVARDMVDQSDVVNMALAKRVEETADAKAKMENCLQSTLREIASQEKNIEALKHAIKEKEKPIKVAQTRLHMRSDRPGVDLCRDPAQYKLVEEVRELCDQVDALQKQLDESDESLRQLKDTRMTLEKEIAQKANSLFLDQKRCMQTRQRYPTAQKLIGYN